MIRSDVDRQIIAMGGGGFAMEPENSLLDRYILDTIAGADGKLFDKQKPRVCFIPTASGDSSSYIDYLR